MPSRTGWISANFIGFGVVLLIPCRGHFICPLAVAGLALRYLFINFSLRFGHPSRKPCRTALRSVEIFGLHRTDVQLDTISSCFDGVCETCHVCNSFVCIRWHCGSLLWWWADQRVSDSACMLAFGAILIAPASVRF